MAHCRISHSVARTGEGCGRTRGRAVLLEVAVGFEDDEDDEGDKDDQDDAREFAVDDALHNLARADECGGCRAM